MVEVDLTAVARAIQETGSAWRERGIEPSSTPFLARALLAAVAAAPQINAAFDARGPGVRRHPAVHLGLSLLAADGSSARHVVVRDADTRSLLGLALEVEAARAGGSPDPSLLAAATITLADYGPESALFGVPLVLPGQVAAVRAGAVAERLLVRGRGFALAPTVYLCASIDHRALDGADAGALLGAMKRFLEADRPRDAGGY